MLDGVEHLLVGLPEPASSAVLEALSRAEREVVCAALAGGSNALIARARGVAPRTIANQLASAFLKLGVSSRAELAGLVAHSGG